MDTTNLEDINKSEFDASQGIGTVTSSPVINHLPVGSMSNNNFWFVALAFRVFAKFDLGESIAGHITVRDPVDPESFWVNPFGKFSRFAKY